MPDVIPSDRRAISRELRNCLRNAADTVYGREQGYPLLYKPEINLPDRQLVVRMTVPSGGSAKDQAMQTHFQENLEVFRENVPAIFKVRENGVDLKVVPVLVFSEKLKLPQHQRMNRRVS
jgi:hypothetical protein